MIIHQSQQVGTGTTQQIQSSEAKKQVKRTKGHEALLKVKEVESHIDMMRRRNKYLQVRDQLNRSLTIQHERKLFQHQQRRLQAKSEKQQLERYNRMKLLELESVKQKNNSLREEREKNIAQTYQKYYSDKVSSYRTIRAEQNKNEESINKYRESDQKQKEERRRSVNEMELSSKNNISRYRQNRYKDAMRYQSKEFDSLMSLAANKQKQLQRLSKIEEEMVKKNSQSMQISQLTKNRVMRVFGDERRLGRLPEIKNSPTRGSTSNTQILIL